LRYGLNGACLALAVAQLAVIVTMQWRNYAPWSLMEFQLLMLVLTMTGLLTGVVVSERFRAEAAFRRSEMRLREKQAELVHVSRLKLLGEMGSAVAHELNQPIRRRAPSMRAGERLAASCGAACSRRSMPCCRRSPSSIWPGASSTASAACSPRAYAAAR
jgi:glucose-6-phosphate-specific signal transduction histidine kinase